MNIYKKYDVATKIAYVEKYLALKGNNGNKISITKFCHENDIAKTTFYDWLSKYNNADLDNNTDNNVLININNGNNNLPTFIELSNIEEPSSNNNSNTDIKLSYKDVTLEFKDNQLEKVLGIIKRW